MTIREKTSPVLHSSEVRDAPLGHSFDPFFEVLALAQLKCNEHDRIVRQVAKAPLRGDVVPSCARKVRFAGRSKGKSGGYRIVTFFVADDGPALLLALINKGERADLAGRAQ
jgi:hypothetical protein